MRVALPILLLTTACSIADPGFKPFRGEATYVVVRGPEDTPCPHAEIAMLTDANAPRALELRATGATPADIVFRLGRRYRCDADGRVVLPFVGYGSQSALLAARWQGQETVDHEYVDESGGRLQVRPPDLAIRVVDAAGQPSPGRPVSAYSVYDDDEVDSAPIQVAWSDADGIATFRHWNFDHQPRRRVVAPGWPLSREDVLSLGVQPNPKDPATLRLPPDGALKVRVRTKVGRRPRDVVVTLEPLDTERVVREPTQGDDPDPVWLTDRDAWRPRVPGPDGDAFFPHVGLGMRMKLVVEAIDMKARTVEIQGPTDPGETAVVDVTIHPPPAFVARLVDENGRPLAGYEWEAATGENRPTYAQSGTTGPDGGIRYVDPWWSDGAPPYLYVMLRPYGAVHGARWPVPRHTSPGDLDLGELVVPMGDVVVEGVILGPDGRPVPEAMFHIGFDSGEWLEWFGPFWPSCYTQDGRFLVTGGFHDVSDRLFLHCLHDEFTVSRPLRFERGARGLALRVDRPGAAAASVRLHEDFHLEQFTAEIIDRDGGKRTTAEPDAEDEGRFHLAWDDLMPGTYDFELRVGAIATPVARVERIVVQAGKTTRDPRIDAIDLRSRVRTVLLEVPKDQLPSSESELRAWRINDDETVQPIHLDHYGASVVILDDRPASVWLAAPDEYAAVRVDGITANREVRLREAHRITIKLDGILADADVEFRCALSRGHCFFDPERDWPFVERDWALVKKTEIGIYEIRAWCTGLWEPVVTVNGRNITTVPSRFEVTDSPNQTVRLRLR